MASNSLWAHLFVHLHLLHKVCCLPENASPVPTLLESSYYQQSPQKIKIYKSKLPETFLSRADDMESDKICKSSSTTNDRNSNVDSAPSEVYLHMPLAPTGTRPCSPSESDISAYLLPPPAYEAFSNALPATPSPKTTPANTEMPPAQGNSPVAAPAAIVAPAPAVIASTPAVVQSSSSDTTAQPAPARPQSQDDDFDVESTTHGDRRRHILVDNSAIRTVRRAGGWSFSYTWELAKNLRWQMKLLIFCSVNLVICLTILGVGLAEG
jgi:hypothetical protein